MARRELNVFSMSYLDVMCCGFGAMILLFILTTHKPPGSLEVSDTPKGGDILSLQEQLFKMRGETTVLNRDLNAKQEQLSDYHQRIARLQVELQEVRKQVNQRTTQTMSTDTEAGKLALARESLTDEMKRLQAQTQRAAKSDAIGGVPVDSEYVVFVIDTSGSMFNYAWNKLQQVITQTLDIYPSLKGIQVLNCEGEYMFSSYQRQWIEDSPARRQAIINKLHNWNPFCSSNPTRGILTAIHDFADPHKKISIYVMGDDFAEGGSIQDVISTVDRINPLAANGERMVRIHGIGFGTQFFQTPTTPVTPSGKTFSTLMRELARKNGGTFVGLNDFY